MLHCFTIIRQWLLYNFIATNFFLSHKNVVLHQNTGIYTHFDWYQETNLRSTTKTFLYHQMRNGSTLFKSTANNQPTPIVFSVSLGDLYKIIAAIISIAMFSHETTSI